MDTITVRPFTPEDADWVVARHRALYARDEGFDDSFGDLVSQVLQGFVLAHDPAREAGWIAEGPDGRLGCIFCVELDRRTAKIRMFLLVPEARGTGLGRRMLDTCMCFARQTGYKRMRLWTHESHKAAGALYAKAGWKLGASKQVHSYGKDNVEQSWSITL